MLFSSSPCKRLNTIHLVFAALHASLSSAQSYQTPSETQSYLLNYTYTGSDFFTGWDFFSSTDPTNGYVDYQTSDQAWTNRLISTTNGSAYIGVDHSSTVDDSARGRKSVRIESQKSWTQGLFIADIEHMPASACGVWPAFWMLGSGTWPRNGEIDIIEGVNAMSDNLVSLHTPDCTMTQGPMSGKPNCLNCDGDLNSNSACNANALDTNAIGSGFNSISGGVYAMEWTSSSIQVWFYPRSSIPGDITSGAPDPTGWGMPQTHYQGGDGCSIDDHFEDHSLVINTAFCGDWAGGEWYSDVECSAKGATCAGYVRDNPADFTEAYWLINDIKIYQMGMSSTTVATSTSAESSPITAPATLEISPTTTSASSSRPTHSHSHPFLTNSTLYNTTHFHHHYNSTNFNDTASNETITSTIEITLTLTPVHITSTPTATLEIANPVTVPANSPNPTAYDAITTQSTTVTIQGIQTAFTTLSAQKKQKREKEHVHRHLRRLEV